MASQMSGCHCGSGTTQVMLGVSLRARWDKTLVTTKIKKSGSNIQENAGTEVEVIHVMRSE